MNNRPHIIRRLHGEYSTVQIGDVIETMWFPTDPGVPEELVGRTLVNLASIGQAHVAAFEAAC